MAAAMKPRQHPKIGNQNNKDSWRSRSEGGGNRRCALGLCQWSVSAAGFGEEMFLTLNLRYRYRGSISDRLKTGHAPLGHLGVGNDTVQAL